MGKFFHYVAESILLGEDKLSDFAKKNQVGEEFEQKIRRVCQKIGPRGLSKYGVWLA